MAIDPSELLKDLDEVESTAGAAVEGAWEQLRLARIAESRAIATRESGYTAAFAGGLVIEKVLEPAKVAYFAGFKTLLVGGIFGEDRYQDTWLLVDQRHANKLTGTLVSDVGIQARSSYRYVQDDRLGKMGGLRLNFRVPQELTNTKANVPDDITPASVEPMYRGYTKYSASLEGLQWRFPTDEEILEFGSIPVPEQIETE